MFARNKLLSGSQKHQKLLLEMSGRPLCVRYSMGVRNLEPLAFSPWLTLLVYILERWNRMAVGV